MNRMKTALAVVGAVSVVIGTGALAAGRGADGAQGVSPGSPGVAVCTTAPVAGPVPEPPDRVAPAVHIPPSVIAKYDPRWGLLGRVQAAWSVKGGPTGAGADAPGSLLVVGDRAMIARGGIDCAWVALRPTTTIVALRDGSLVPTVGGRIRVGSIVAVTFTGPVAESYPLQAAAERIVILD